MMHLPNYTGPRDLNPQHVRAIIDAQAQRHDAHVQDYSDWQNRKPDPIEQHQRQAENAGLLPLLIKEQCESLATDQVYRLLAHDVRAYRWWQDYRLRNEGWEKDEAEADGWLDYYGSRIDGILAYLRG